SPPYPPTHPPFPGDSRPSHSPAGRAVVPGHLRPVLLRVAADPHPLPLAEPRLLARVAARVLVRPRLPVGAHAGPLQLPRPSALRRHRFALPSVAFLMPTP